MEDVTVHYLVGRRYPVPACGAHKRWASCWITGTRGKKKVSCQNCKKIVKP